LTALAAAVAFAGIPTPSQAVPIVQAAAPVLGCNGEPVQMRPSAAPPFKQSRNKINLGYAEWHFPPSCKDDVRRDWVKIYRVVAGKKDPRVYYTKSDRYTKKFKDGKYRGKAQYSYRYYKGDGKHGPWHTFIVRSEKIRLS
jgi:dienelactone hydrolase